MARPTNQSTHSPRPKAPKGEFLTVTLLGASILLVVWLLFLAPGSAVPSHAESQRFVIDASQQENGTSRIMSGDAEYDSVRQLTVVGLASQCNAYGCYGRTYVLFAPGETCNAYGGCSGTASVYHAPNAYSTDSSQVTFPPVHLNRPGIWRVAQEYSSNTVATFRVEEEAPAGGTFVGGAILSNMTWTEANSPYIVKRDTTVFPGYELTIEPGTTVKFYNGTRLTVRGTLHADGAPSEPITFTSANSSVPGSWQGIYIVKSGGGRASVHNAHVSFAQRGLSFDCCNYASPQRVANVTFTGNVYGIYGQEATLLIEDSLFQGNTYGAELHGYPGSVIARSQFVANYRGAYFDYGWAGRLYESAFINNTYGFYSYNAQVTDNVVQGSTGYGGYVVHAYVARNVFEGNNLGIGLGYSFGCCENSAFVQNTVVNNTVGVDLPYYYYGAPIHSNNLGPNSEYSVRSTGPYDRLITNNWWGTTDPAAIEASIYDAHDNANLGLVYYEPFLQAPVPIVLPGSPRALTAAEGPFSGQVTLSWTPPANLGDSPLQGYRIYRAPSGGWPSFVAQTNNTTYIDTDLPPLSSWRYTVHAVNGAGEGRGSNNVSITLTTGQFSTAFQVYGPEGRSDVAILGTAVNATAGFDTLYDAPEPPAPVNGSYVQAFFHYPGNEGDTKHLHKSTVRTAASLSWPLRVNTSGSGGSVTLLWNKSDFQRVSGNGEAYLVDGSTEVDLRNRSSYTFAVGSGLQSRDFVVRVRTAADISVSAETLVMAPIVKVGGSLRVNGTVQNLGQLPATDVRVSLRIDGVLVQANVSTSPAEVPVGGSATFSFAPAVQSVPGGHNVTVEVVTASEDRNLVNNVATKPYFVAQYALSLTAGSVLEKTVEAGQVANYTFHLFNGGNAPTRYWIYPEGTPYGWTAEVSSYDVTLAPGETRTLRMNVYQWLTSSNVTVANVPLRVVSANDTNLTASILTTTRVIVRYDLHLQTGWNLVSVPIALSNRTPEAAFGPAVEAVYEWNGNRYALATEILPGRGYWVLVAYPSSAQFVGYPVENLTLELQAGWNLVGVGRGAATLTNAPAHVVRTVWSWNATRYVDGTLLLPGRGYWVYAHEASAQVRLPRSNGAMSIDSPVSPFLPAASGPEAFLLAVGVARTDGAMDTVTVGMAPDAESGFAVGEDQPEAPASLAQSWVQAYVEGSSQTANSMRFDRMVMRSAESAAWFLQVDGRGAAGTVSLTWDPQAFESLAGTYTVELVDGATRVNMRESDRYTFETRGGFTKEFTILVYEDALLEPVCLADVNGTCVVQSPVNPFGAL
ncbi:MAG TPA: NosD domain-containing protein [Candidatus Thermoplasmatota archaeon]|nr:NosD domain-containing protein [Candidatus Thermoplasmatota archaeon]